MTKRSAGSDSLHEAPLKKCRLGTDTRLQAVHAPPLHVNMSTRQRCRKRPSSSDEEGHHHQPQRRDEEEEEEQQRRCKRTLSGSTGSCSRLQVTSLTSNEGPTEQRAAAEAMPSKDLEQLCEFNTFQFWRNPLPELDLSLLDDVSTAVEVSAADSSLKNIPEAMET